MSVSSFFICIHHAKFEKKQVHVLACQEPLCRGCSRSRSKQLKLTFTSKDSQMET